MSRREPRVSINVRQNDALNEFENFKKKFLLANKHITKLNSTLSVRIEELNAQISTLYVENLRLRASEIALAAQLQREREKSWRIMADAETATHNLSKHLGHMRKSYNISHSSPSPPQQPPAPPPRTRRPMPDPAASPQTTRLSRAPNIPGIYEDDEECEVSSSSDDNEKLPSPTVRRKMKARLSASRLPLPSRVSSPPLPPAPPLVIENKGKKKVSRRQSGLLTVNTARPPSPAVGSALQKLAQEAEPDEEDDAAITEEMDVDAELESALRRERKNKSESQEREADGDVPLESGRPRERKRRRNSDETSSTTTTKNSEGAKKLTDVTNSPRGRSALPPLDTNTSVDREPQRSPETEPTTATSAAPSSLLPFPSNESTPATTPATSYPVSDPRSSTYLPTPRPSSSPPPTSASETEGPAPNGRATRTRKSVNYAEPKLNTKMRKPDSEPSSTGTKKRSSMSAKSQPPQPLAVEDSGSRPPVEQVPPRSKKRSSMPTNPQPPPLPADDSEPRSSFETVPAPPSRNLNQPQEIKSRPALSSSTHPYSQAQSHTARSTSVPSSSSASTSMSFRPISSSHTYVTTPAPNSSATTTIKRKKSRPYVDPDDEDSDGAQADAEFGGGTGLTNGWVNVDGRRKSVLHGHGGVGSSKERERNGERRLEGEEVRRHSMAV